MSKCLCGFVGYVCIVYHKRSSLLYKPEAYELYHGFFPHAALLALAKFSGVT